MVVGRLGYVVSALGHVYGEKDYLLYFICFGQTLQSSTCAKAEAPCVAETWLPNAEAMPGHGGNRRYFTQDIATTDELQALLRTKMNDMMEVRALQCTGTLPCAERLPECGTLPLAGL